MAAPRTQFYHPAEPIDAALHAVERSIRRAEGVALVVGQPGTGKSLLLAMIAEHVRDDFDVAFLSGARILTRRALWQSILAEIGEPYRGIDEGELRMAVVERIRGLAATGSGLVILVDEAHTLPTRLIEELRLLTNVPTPLPAVHIVLAGGTRLEELLALPRMESLAQRIAVRSYLEPLDHAETMRYLRALPKAAGLDWDGLFAPGCDDAVFTATDGVPRLVNQLCDQALVNAGAGGRRVTPADIAAAWREIQRLPAPSGGSDVGRHDAPPPRGHGHAVAADLDGDADGGMATIEFGGFDDEPDPEPARIDAAEADHGDQADHAAAAPQDPWRGPDVELVFDSGTDPFDDFFARREGGDDRGVERYVVQSADDFGGHPHVTSREGQALARLLADCNRGGDVPAPAPRADRSPAPPAPPAAMEAEDDADMVVIEDDLADADPPGGPRVFPVRPGDYRSLFTRLRRGDR
jgi:type II secretory pathway predicted ATPase ExeA